MFIQLEWKTMTEYILNGAVIGVLIWPALFLYVTIFVTNSNNRIDWNAIPYEFIAIVGGAACIGYLWFQFFTKH